MSTSVSPNKLTEKEESGAGIRVIARSAKILRTLNDEPKGMSLGQIAVKVGLPRSTVQRIVGALKSEGFIIDGPSESKIRIGPAFFSIAAASLSDFRDPIRPFLEELSENLGETVDLSILSGDQVVFLDQCSTREKRLLAVSEIGASFPAYSCAPGKSLLSELTDDQLTRLLPQTLPHLTEETIPDLAKFIKEMEIIRQTGVAYDREEHTDGICAVSTVIRSLPRGTAALSIPMPAQRFYGEEKAYVAPLLRCRDKISHSLGFLYR